MVENDIITEFRKNCTTRVGTAGTTPFSANTAAWMKQARKALVNNLSEIDPASVHLVLGTDAMANALELTNFQRQDYGAGAEALARGQMSDKLGASWFENQLVPDVTGQTGYLVDSSAAAIGADADEHPCRRRIPTAAGTSPGDIKIPVDRGSGLASDQESVWAILPETFSLKFGFVHGREFVVDWKVGVLRRPRVEVLIGALFVNAARHQVGGPSTVRLLARHRVCADGHVGVHEDATGAERPVNACIQREFACHGGNVVQGQGCGHGVTRGEWRLERPPADTSAAPKSLKPKARLGQHLRIDVDGFNGTDAFMVQHRFSQGARSRAEVKHQGWANISDFVGSPRQAFFVAWNERADGLVVGINLKAKMMADGVVHQLIVGLIVGRWL